MNSPTDLKKGSLSAAAVTLIAISAVAPMTNLAGVLPIAILFGNGAAIVPAFVVTMFLLLIFAVGYVAIAKHIQNAGAFYTIVRKGLGDKAGAASACIALLAYNALQVGVYGLFGVVFGALVLDVTGLSVPWWVYSIATAAIIWALAYRRIEITAKVLYILVGLEFAVVMLLDILIVFKGIPAGFTLAAFSLSNVPSAGALGITFVYAFGCYAGFEATTVYRAEAIDPDRSISKATYATVLIIGLFYAVSAMWLVAAVGTDKIVSTIAGLKDPVDFVFNLARMFGGPWLENLMRLLFVTSLFACLLAFHNHIARYLFTLARDRLLPHWLGKVHPDTQTPYRACALQTGIAVLAIAASVFTGLDPIMNLFAWFGNVAVLAIVVMVILVCGSIIAFFMKGGPDIYPGVIAAVLSPMASGLGFIAIAYFGVSGFDVLTGATGPLQYILPGLIPIAGLVGVILASTRNHAMVSSQA